MKGLFARRSVTAVLSLILLGLIMGAHSLIPPTLATSEPISTSGGIGSTVDARQFTIEVQDVRFARTITDDAGGDDFGAVSEPIEANGVWVIVLATIESTRSTMSSVTAELDTGDDYTYSGTAWSANVFESSSPSLSPGRPVTGAFAFEVPEDRLTELSLRATVSESADERLAAQADIDLGLSGSELTENVDGAEDVAAIPPIETH
ncbi:hypothetical protein ACFOVU_28650 [Nocardiopsis sediminis]|uniref:DUF4352 domain-containing protein n=1 Tax=Nocardiopsis sediminis TaxID=1778267 RepID=A0ABV8FZ54_9ACTN